MRLTKREPGRRTVSELSELSGCRSKQWDSASGPARSFPGIWTIFKSKSARSRSHLAWHQFSFWAWQKYVKFLWLVNTYTRKGEL